MGKRLTTEYVRGKVEERGWVFKDKEYVDAHTKMNLVCPNGHDHSIKWNDFQQGYGCPYCAGNMKHDIVYAKNKFAEFGCMLVSTKYVSANKKLDYICSNGHEHSMSLAHLQEGHKCPYCVGNNIKHDIEYIRNKFEETGCILKSTTYVNNSTLLDYICPNGHEHSVTWAGFRRGNGCPYCSGLAKPKIEHIREEFDKRGCILKSTEYINAHTKLDYICSNEHEHSITWNDFQQGNGCPYCSGVAKHTIDYISAQFGCRGCVLKSKVYVNGDTKLDYICPNGHEHSISWNDFQQGVGCPKCSHNVSKQEMEIQSFLNYNGINFIANTRDILINPLTNSRLELDVWFPKLNKAIEFNGEYWHNKPDTIKRDKIKLNLCRDKGIGLMVIMYKEWMSNKKECKQRMIGFLQ